MTATQRWISFHIFYHTGDRDHLLVDCVLPTARGLLQDKKADSFFFVRYLLGGPHIRLRLLPCPGLEDSLCAFVERRVADFLRCHPSPAPLASEVISDQNRSLLHQDHNEQDDSIFPDNSCMEQPFLPETDRYGGPGLIEHSLDFFALSSARVLRLLTGRGDCTKGGWLTIALRLLVRQSLGFARDSGDLVGLSDYSARYWEKGAAPIQDIADRIFAQRQESFMALVGQEVRRLSPDLHPVEDTETARCLDRELRSTDAPTRWRILSSQLHMTANRLGLRNADEIYLARIFRRSLDEINRSDPTLWTCLEEVLAERMANSYGGYGTRLRELLRPTFEVVLPG